LAKQTHRPRLTSEFQYAEDSHKPEGSKNQQIGRTQIEGHYGQHVDESAGTEKICQAWEAACAEPGGGDIRRPKSKEELDCEEPNCHDLDQLELGAKHMLKFRNSFQNRGRNGGHDYSENDAVGKMPPAGPTVVERASYAALEDMGSW
jgi:hypothetical protein